MMFASHNDIVHSLELIYVPSQVMFQMQLHNIALIDAAEHCATCRVKSQSILFI
jgi:hypothetical protein